MQKVKLFCSTVKKLKQHNIKYIFKNQPWLIHSYCTCGMPKLMNKKILVATCNEKRLTFSTLPFKGLSLKGKDPDPEFSLGVRITDLQRSVAPTNLNFPSI